MRRRSSAAVGGRPGGRCGWVQCRAMRRRCQRNSVSGVTSQPARLGWRSAAATAPSRARSPSLSAGRLIWRRRTVSWWRNTMISRSFERPDRTANRASDARNRYKIRYTRTQHRPALRQVNDHGRISGTLRLADMVVPVLRIRSIWNQSASAMGVPRACHLGIMAARLTLACPKTTRLLWRESGGSGGLKMDLPEYLRLYIASSLRELWTNRTVIPLVRSCNCAGPPDHQLGDTLTWCQHEW